MKTSRKNGKKGVPEKPQAGNKGYSLCERFTGLTLSEHKKLKELKKSLAGGGAKSGKQISAQPSLLKRCTGTGSAR